MAGVAVGRVVGVIVGNSGVTVAVGGAIVAEGEIDGLGVIVAVVVGVAVMIVGVTTTGGGAVHCASSTTPAAIRARPISAIAMYLP